MHLQLRMPRKPRPTLKRPLAWAGAHSPVYPWKSEVASSYVYAPQQATEPSLLTPQVWSCPALPETKEPAGGVWPRRIHCCTSRRWSRCSSPRRCGPPSAQETKEPAGGVAWPYSSEPQQATEPSLLTPQVWAAPALTESKDPEGGVASPFPL